MKFCLYCEKKELVVPSEISLHCCFCCQELLLKKEDPYEIYLPWVRMIKEDRKNNTPKQISFNVKELMGILGYKGKIISIYPTGDKDIYILNYLEKEQVEKNE